MSSIGDDALERLRGTSTEVVGGGDGAKAPARAGRRSAPSTRRAESPSVRVTNGACAKTGLIDLQRANSRFERGARHSEAGGRARESFDTPARRPPVRDGGRAFDAA
jgi:hypothetical protein